VPLRGLDEAAEEPPVLWRLGLRVPLNADHEATVDGLDALDDPVRGPGDGAELATELVGRLAV
jgi:hypothetical protein